VKWAIQRGIPNVSSPILVDNVLFLSKEGGVLTAVRAEDGAVLKEGRISPAFGPLFPSPVAASGKLYIANQQGRVTVLKAESEWNVLTVNDLGEECYATPYLHSHSLHSLVLPARCLTLLDRDPIASLLP